MKLKNVFLIIFLVFVIQKNYSQYYNVSAFQSEYHQIENYNSIMLETSGALFWHKRFELPFNFKYFDQIFDYLECDYNGTCSFDDEIDYSMRLLVFGYECDNVVDPNNIQSDIRYKIDSIDGIDYLVVQFTKCRLSSDTTVETYDSNVNFQWWFYEDGRIEIHFGNSNLAHSNVYVPGEGFYLLTDDGPIRFGPQLALWHPYDESIKLGYSDLENYNSFEIVYDDSDKIDWWPPEGWVIRFDNLISKNSDIIEESSAVLAPNPVNQTFYIDEFPDFESISIYSIEGRRVLYIEYQTRMIDVSSLPSGIYFYSLKTKKNSFNCKFIKS